MDLSEGEGFEVRAGLPNGRLDVLLQELVHVDAKEWPGLMKNLVKFRRHCLEIVAAQSCPKNLIIANIFPASVTAEIFQILKILYRTSLEQRPVLLNIYYPIFFFFLWLSKMRHHTNYGESYNRKDGQPYLRTYTQ